MAQLAPPSSQKAGDRPISFLLDGNGGSAFVDLVIRPEDLVRTDPSRINVQQTLGGAWADNFGPGIGQITIGGHTGWRRTEGGNDDGVGRFAKLKETVFDEWHQRRSSVTKSGLDPNGVKLIFTDALDNFSVNVAPMSFVLRRSRSRPLLCQFQIALTVLEELGESQVFSRRGALQDAALKQSLGLDSLTASIDEITGMINDAHKFVDASLAGPVRAFMNQTARLYSSVRGAISAGVGLTNSVISIAQMSAQAGLNLFRTMAAVASIPQQVKASLMAVAGAYSNVFCVLRNALQQQLFIQDYSDLYGASNCSSTSGGRPISSLAGENPFYQVVPTGGPSMVTATQPAQTGLRALAGGDPVLAPMSTPSMGSALNTIVGGLAVA